mmetsp:Transcript_10496/g.64283  ORF Transcript_10496/g.64283 Transcript_10496/m.64283 type:complete len:95 (-) Transcript_10496:6611-6895(-)
MARIFHREVGRENDTIDTVAPSAPPDVLPPIRGQEKRRGVNPCFPLVERGEGGWRRESCGAWNKSTTNSVCVVLQTNHLHPTTRAEVMCFEVNA